MLTLGKVVSIALLVAAPLAAIANQHGTFVGLHDLPTFVCDRVDLVAGSSAAERNATDDIPSPGSLGAVCARGAVAAGMAIAESAVL